MKYTPNQINKWMLFKLPAAWLTGVRVSLISETKCEVKVRFKWINQNPYRSMFWAVQGMAAELSTAVFLMWTIKKTKQPVSMLVLKNQATFKKKAKGLIRFHCTQGKEAIAAVKKTIATGEATSVTLKSVGTDSQEDIVSEFEFEWSLKKK